MRQVFSRSFVTLALLVCLALPANAQPQRDDGSSTVIDRIVHFVKHQIKRILPLDTIDASTTKP